MPGFASDVAFTPTVKAIQSREGSRAAYSRMEQGGSWETTVTSELREFLATLDMFYLGNLERARTALHPVPRRSSRLPQID